MTTGYLYKKYVLKTEIVYKLVAYPENNHDIQSGKTTIEQKFIFLKRLCECEYWLSKQFSSSHLAWGALQVFGKTFVPDTYRTAKLWNI